MRSDEPDINHAIRIVDPNDQPILVAGNVEDHPTITQDAGGAEIPFYFARCLPLRQKHIPVPGKRGLTSIGMRGLSDQKLRRVERTIIALPRVVPFWD